MYWKMKRQIAERRRRRHAGSAKAWRLMWMRVVLAVAIVISMSADMKASEIHVAPTGDDANPGTADAPLATVAAAQRQARAINGREPVTVRLHQGVYYLAETLTFTPEDSDCTYAAVAGQTVVLSGGVKMSLNWELHRDGIYMARTPEGLAIDQLFIDGKRQWMARYPNYQPEVRPFGGTSEDAISKQRAARWNNPAGGYIHSIQKHAWGSQHYRITGKNDDGEVTYEGGWQNNRPTAIHPVRRYVENIFEELDAPHEWYHNAKTQTLYFYPPADVDLAKASVETVRLPHLVEFSGTQGQPVRRLTLRGLTFRHASRTFMQTKEPLLRSDWTIYRGGAVFFDGAEDCTIVDCEFDQLGGNAIMLSNYNRKITIRGCDIHNSGASGVAFVGSPKAVRSPRFEYSQHFNYDQIDKTPGPKTDDYPADCVVDDCLIHNVGVVEKQSSGVQISMSLGITVRHCSIYDTPRAGINISEGTFGGHVIEFCDVFGTVRETGDHGSFNAWGRDRFWRLGGAPADELAELSKLDMVKPNIIPNSRWRCDHGWDVDLDDGSSNYEIYNNVFLRGGLKLREGFNRKVYNNVAVNSTLHPHVWFKGSGDEVTRNIWMGPYRPAIMKVPTWGKQVDYNLFTTTDADRTRFADHGCDAHSRVGDPLFVDAAKGDYRVKEGSPALKLGFVNFPMDQFGVRSPRLRAMARTPELPEIQLAAKTAQVGAGARWRGALLRPLEDEEFSAIGVPADASGLLVVELAEGPGAAKAGLKVGDFIQSVNGTHVGDTKAFLQAISKAPDGQDVTLALTREQQSIRLQVKKLR